MKNKNNSSVNSYLLVSVICSVILVGCNTAAQMSHEPDSHKHGSHKPDDHEQHSMKSIDHGDHDMSSPMGSMEHMNHMQHGKADPKLYTNRSNAVTHISKSGNYRVSLFSNESPIPVKKIHTWTVHVEDKTGKPFEEGKVYVNGGMPMHNHDFPTVPKVTGYLGNGDYKVEGIKFNMYGHWEIRFNIQRGRDTDRVVFNFNFQPQVNTVAHQWTEQELARISPLWIGYLDKNISDPSNRVFENPDAAALGQKLFFDKRFSANGQVACASCHKPDLYFTDGLKVGQGIGTVTRNSPTIVGASFHNWFFHDGRADSLWAQAMGPLEDRKEHGGSRTQYAHIIYNDPEYRASYEKLFGPMPDLSDKKRFPVNAGPVRDKKRLKAWKRMAEADQTAITDIFVNMAKAIAAYERLLKPAPSRFDNYVKALMDRNKEAMDNLMSEEELAGLKLFVTKANCWLCHNGPMFTDFSFHNIATPPVNVKKYDYGRKKAIHIVKKSPFNCRGEYNDAKDKNCDELEYMEFHEEETMAAFKTPSLRNVTKTAPYMHAGQYKTLSEVMKHYADPPGTKVGLSDLLPVELNDKELAQLEAFLKTLDSPIDADPKLLSSPTAMEAKM